MNLDDYEHVEFCDKCREWYGWTWDDNHELSCRGKYEEESSNHDTFNIESSESFMDMMERLLLDKKNKSNNYIKEKHEPIVKEICTKSSDDEDLEELFEIAEILADDKTNEVLAKIKKKLNIK